MVYFSGDSTCALNPGLFSQKLITVAATSDGWKKETGVRITKFFFRKKGFPHI